MVVILGNSEKYEGNWLILQTVREKLGRVFMFVSSVKQFHKENRVEIWGNQGIIREYDLLDFADTLCILCYIQSKSAVLRQGLTQIVESILIL